VYVADVAESMLRVATAPLPAPGRLDARAFNIGTGVGTSVNRLATILRDAARSDVAIENAPRRAGEMQHSVLDVEKAREALGWSARVSIEEGLGRTFEWFAARRGAQANAR